MRAVFQVPPAWPWHSQPGNVRLSRLHARRPISAAAVAQTPDSKEEAGYRHSHLAHDQAREYAEGYRDRASLKHFYWQLEKEILETILSEHDTRKKCLLDFACGTGRVLSFLEDRFQSSTGIDISINMLKEAVKCSGSSQLINGDVTTRDPIREGHRFDVITVFRFFLNAEPPLRQAVLAWIQSHLADDGVMICNFHFNPLSAMGLRRLLGKFLRWALLAHREQGAVSVSRAQRLLQDAGFTVLKVYGYGHLLYRRRRYAAMLPGVAELERLLMKIRFISRLARNFILVCRKVELTPPA